MKKNLLTFALAAMAVMGAATTAQAQPSAQSATVHAQTPNAPTTAKATTPTPPRALSEACSACRTLGVSISRRATCLYPLFSMSSSRPAYRITKT